MKILVSDVMTRDPFSAKPDITLQDVAKIMVKKRTGSLLIVDKRKLIGFITEKDIIWAITKKPKKDLPRIKAIEICPRKIATIRPSATIMEAITKMQKTKFQRLPVIYNGELVGMITMKDILNFNPGLYPELEEFSKIREESEKLKRVKKAETRKSVDGMCEECGNFDTLTEINGELICESCASSR